MGSITPTIDQAYSKGPQPPYPLHPSIESKLDPVYKKFYNENLINQQQVHLRSVAESRTSGVLIPGAGPLIPVGSTEDLHIKRLETSGPDILVRVFTPPEEVADGVVKGVPEGGWPVFLYFHGGGWVLGNIDTENVVCTNICARARCVVVTVDYRLAPEDPFPAAVHDSWESLLWLHNTGCNLLNLNPLKTATGGSSAGGNLAAVLTQKALTRPSLPPFLAQLLIVPVTSNIALPSSSPAPKSTISAIPNYSDPYAYPSYTSNQFTPALPAPKMLWYRTHYLPSPSTHISPLASPLLWEGDWSKLPRALVVVGELDVLRSEGEFYADRLREGGVEVEEKCWIGMPHPFLAMDGVLEQGRGSIGLMVGLLRDIFGT